MKRKPFRTAASATLALSLVAQLLTGTILSTTVLPVTASKSSPDTAPDTTEVYKTDPEPRENIVLNAFLIPMYDEAMRRQQMQLCADADIDILSLPYPAPVLYTVQKVHTPEWYKQAMKEASEYGLTLMTREIRLQNCLSMSDEDILSLAKEYKDLPGFGGFYVIDEPINPSIYAHTANLLHSVCPDTLINVNFLPRGAYFENYLYQLTDYASLLNYNGSLSLDVYCFPPNGGVNETALFSNYEDLWRAGLKTGSDTAVYVQSVGSPNQYGYRRPAPADIRYNVMAALAYGVKEIKYFTWGTPIPEEGAYTEAIIGSDGLPTDLYDDVCKINAYVHAIGQYIAACDAKEIYHSKQNSAYYQAVPADLFIQPVGNCEIIISLLEERGGSDEYIMLVNKNISAAQTFTCSVEGVNSLEIVNAEGNLVPLSLKDGKFTLTLEAGDSAVVKLPEGDFIKTAERKLDLAQSAIVTATSTTSDAEANMYVYNTYDGMNDGGGVCLKSADDTPQSLTFDLHEITTVNRVDIAPARLGEACGSKYPDELTIATSVDGKEWKVVASTKKGDIARPITTVPTFRFADTDARYVRVTVTGFANATVSYELGDISIYNDKGNIPEGAATRYQAPAYDLGKNVAVGASVHSYSSTADLPQWGAHSSYINDGKASTTWCTALGCHSSADAEEWITIDLKDIYTVDKVILTPAPILHGNNNFPVDYCIEVSTDNETYTKVVEIIGDPGQRDSSDRVFPFDDTDVRYVRLRVTKLSYQRGAGMTGYGAEIAEIAVLAATTDTETKPPETETEPDTDPVTTPETDPATEPDTTPVTEPDTTPDTTPDTDGESETERDTEAETPAGTAADTSAAGETEKPDEGGCASSVALGGIVMATALVAGAVVCRRKED